MSEPVIIPAILTDSFSELRKQIQRLDKTFKHIHIDILDDTLVPGLTFDDVEFVKTISTTAKLELHFMVNNPLEHIPYWENVTSVFRILVHVEATCDIKETINAARERNWQVGIALNPETPLEKINPYLKQVDTVQFMTVHPGGQGAPFVPEVIEKIKKFTSSPHHPVCAVDGAMSEKTIKQLRDAGVTQFVVGSYFAKSTDLGQSLQTLQKLL